MSAEKIIENFGTTLPNGMKIGCKPQRIHIYIPKRGRCLLCVRRDGKETAEKITRKVAAELISSGFGYCD